MSRAPSEDSAVRNVRIVPLDTLPQPRRLATVAEAVFGAGQRPDGWFARKLRRECVDTSLSPVAIDPDRDPDDVLGWLGYVLVGTPPSLGHAVRTAGTGVLESARGAGIGGALLSRAAYLAAAAGYGELQLLSAPERVSFYVRHGLAVSEERVTLVRPSVGPRDAALPGPLPWDGLGQARGSDVLVQWLPEAWAHTEAGVRHTVALPHGFAHVSDEGRALLVHRCVASGDPPAVLQSLLERLPGGRPVLLPLLPVSPADPPSPLSDRVSTITSTLREHGWHPIQAATLLRRRLAAP